MPIATRASDPMRSPTTSALPLHAPQLSGATTHDGREGLADRNVGFGSWESSQVTRCVTAQGRGDRGHAAGLTPLKQTLDGFSRVGFCGLSQVQIDQRGGER